MLLLYLVFHTDQDDPSSSDDEGMPYTRPVKFKAAHGFKGPYDFDQIKVVQDLSGEHMVSTFLFFSIDYFHWEKYVDFSKGDLMYVILLALFKKS